MYGTQKDSNSRIRLLEMLGTNNWAHVVDRILKNQDGGNNEAKKSE